MMRFVLLSLFSRKDNSSCLAVYDLDKSQAKYVQLMNFSSMPGRIKHIRGIDVACGKVFAVVPWSLLIFELGTKIDGPALTFKQIVTRPEWLFGEKKQGNLHAVHISEVSKRMYLSFNTLCAIDTLDLEGNFIKRKHLWDIVPEKFLIHENIIKKGKFQSGLVSNIFESKKHGLVLNTSMINGEKKGALIGYNSGKVLIDGLSFPHGAQLIKENLYLYEKNDATAYAYSLPIIKKKPIMPYRSFSPVFDETIWPGSVQRMRGITVVDNSLLCGIFHYGKVKPTQIPHRMVEFDLLNGKQVAEHFLPSFEGLQEPQVYSICHVPAWLSEKVTAYREPRYFHGEEEFIPKWIDNNNPDKAKCLRDSHTVSNINTTITGMGKTDANEVNTVRGEKPIKDNAEDKTEYKNPCIVLESVSLCYTRKARSIFGLNKQLKNSRSFWALKDVSFVINEGELVGVIGRNGSGKSSLSMVCTKVYRPDAGEVKVYGRVQLLALGVGFKNELTGRENIFINASLMGFNHKKVKKLIPDIEEFAEIGEFMDEPVRTYSTGMRSRLAFAVATAVQPEILILDEAMSVGDKAFQDKAVARMRSMREKAKTVLVVSHNSNQLKKLCNRILWLEKGRLIMDGEPRKVINAYDNFCQNPTKWLKRNLDKAELLKINDQRA